MCLPVAMIVSPVKELKEDGVSCCTYLEDKNKKHLKATKIKPNQDTSKLVVQRECFCKKGAGTFGPSAYLPGID